MGLSVPMRLEQAAMFAVGRLPRGLARRLAGPPVTIDGHTLDPLTQLALKAINADPDTFDYHPVEQGRAQLAVESAVFGSRPPVGEVSPRTIPLPGRDLPARVYRMRPGRAPGLLMYLHGGGWVLGDLDSCDAVCRVIARRTGLVVVNVGYRLAPEHPFPAAVEDAVEAFRWLRDHLGDFGVAPGAIAVAGESAGGNLTCVVAQETTADEGGGPAVQVPIFPATDHSRDWPSMDTFATGYFLTKRQMGWYRGHYFRDPADRLDPRASPLLARDVSGVAPACVVLAGFDPLRDEGMAYAEKLRAAGVPTEVLLFDGFIHGFINATNLGAEVISRVEQIADRIADGILAPRTERDAR